MEEGAFHSVVNPQHAFKGERLQVGNRHVGKPKEEVRVLVDARR